MAETRRRLIDRFDSNKADCCARVKAIFTSMWSKFFGLKVSPALGFGAWRSRDQQEIRGGQENSSSRIRTGGDREDGWKELFENIRIARVPARRDESQTAERASLFAGAEPLSPASARSSRWCERIAACAWMKWWRGGAENPVVSDFRSAHRAAAGRQRRAGRRRGIL